MRNLHFLAIWLFSLTTFSQKIENIKAIAQGEKIIITYDASSEYAGDKFDIGLYASSNNFSSPLQRITGDVGKGLLAGKGRRIEWDAKAELGNFKGDLSFEIRAEVIAVFAMKSQMKSVKRGKSAQVEWRGGRKDQEVKIELLKGGASQGIISAAAKGGSYSWAVPSDKKTGSDYQLRMVNGDETITSNNFAINHKVPTLIKVVPIVAVVAVVALSGSKSSSSGTTESPNLSEPPDLGLN